MTDMRRTLLWVVFMMSVFFIWEAWNKHTGHPSLFSGPPRAPAAAVAPPGTLPGTTGAAPAAAPLAAGPATPPPAPSTPAVPGEQVTLTTDVVKATFDSVGGELVRLELLKHQEAPDYAWYQPWLSLFGGAGRKAERPDVVLFDRSAKRYYSARTELISLQPGVKLPGHLTPMTAAPGKRTLAAGASEIALRFESAAIDGRKLVKTYTFKRGEYTVAVRHEFVNGGSTPLAAQLSLQLVRDGNPADGGVPFYSTFTGPAVYTELNKFQKIEFKDIAKGSASHDKDGNSGWVAMVQHYFVSAWLFNEPGPRAFRTAKVGDNLYNVELVLPMGEVAAGASKALDSTLFAGPQEESRLELLAPGLELVKDYGWLTVLSKPLFWLLTQLHMLLGNWGWAIVSLVVLLKVAFYWLNAHAYRSMAKMKGVAPRVTELREKYKDKPQEMQQQMMRIYKEEKVNPLGGCLPIFVQMPFFIALYWVLLSSVEMRTAPWLGWIQDLSDKDPYFILPVLMTLSSLFQVWLNPAPPDPLQAKMMWLMPLAFGFMFFVFPAGLVLYWLTNNVLSIAQQWFINKQLGVLGK